jgi:cold shock protein
VGKGNSFREPRRRGFDDDDFSPRSSRGFSPRPTPTFSAPRFEAPSGPVVAATVKWFNPEKGFGFVELADGSGDAFLHGSVLSRTGHGPVSPGTTLQVRIGPGMKGPQVAEVVEVDESTATAEPARRGPGPRGFNRGEGGATIERTGTVRFFDEGRGFGFVDVGDGSKDVFVHASVLRQTGLASLQQGQRVTMQVVDGRRGPEAAAVTVIG